MEYLYGAMLMVSFLFGLKIGIGLKNGKDIELNPIKAVTKTIQDTKEYMDETVDQAKVREKEEKKQQGLMNIINYNGSSEGQI